MSSPLQSPILIVGIDDKGHACRGYVNWKTLLTYITASVDQELLLRNEYLVIEIGILRQQITGCIRLRDGERKTLAELGKRLVERFVNSLQVIFAVAPL